MSFYLTLVYGLVYVLLVTGKRHKRNFSERSLSEAIFFMKNTDVEDIQCILDTTPNCLKRIYVKDLADELDRLDQILSKQKSSNWFTGSRPKYETWEKEIIEDFTEMRKMLPKTTPFKDKAQQDRHNFAHVTKPCMTEYAQINFNDNSYSDFESARTAALQHFDVCESTGINKAKEVLKNMCLSSAEKSIRETNVILEILAEMNDLSSKVAGIMFLNSSAYAQEDDWNKAFKQEALNPFNIAVALAVLERKKAQVPQVGVLKGGDEEVKGVKEGEGKGDGESGGAGGGKVTEGEESGIAGEGDEAENGDVAGAGENVADGGVGDNAGVEKRTEDREIYGRKRMYVW